MTLPGLSIVIPASNEEAYLGECLDSLLSQVTSADTHAPVQIVVVANGCHDATPAIAADRAAAFARRGWGLEVLELPAGGKPGALNAGDRAAVHDARLYLDADIRVGANMLALLIPMLSQDRAVYAGGRLRVVPPRSTVSRLYARFWSQLPFLTEGVSGAGLFAVNAIGRRRWDRFPDIIADDAFVRACFSDNERVLVPEDYFWPMAEGFTQLVRTRRRQNRGMTQLLEQFPELSKTTGTRATASAVLGRAISDPFGFAVYMAINLSTKLRNSGNEFTRGR